MTPGHRDDPGDLGRGPRRQPDQRLPRRQGPDPGAAQRKGGGSIVFTSSFVGFSNGGLPGMGAYAASKAGMIGLVQSLAADHAAEGIRVNALLPGGTVTPWAARAIPTPRPSSPPCTR